MATGQQEQSIPANVLTAVLSMSVQDKTVNSVRVQLIFRCITSNKNVILLLLKGDWYILLYICFVQLSYSEFFIWFHLSTPLSAEFWVMGAGGGPRCHCSPDSDGAAVSDSFETQCHLISL